MPYIPFQQIGWGEEEPDYSFANDVMSTTGGDTFDFGYPKPNQGNLNNIQPSRPYQAVAGGPDAPIPGVTPEQVYENPDVLVPGRGANEAYSGILELLKEYQPTHTASDAFNEAVGRVPVHQEPSWARRLVASGMALGGKSAEADTFLDQPYKADVAAWMAELDPRYKAAQLENTSNQNERLLRQNIATNAYNIGKQQDTLALNTRKQEEVERKNQDISDQARRRQAFAEFKFNHPDWDYKVAGTKLVAVNPRDPSQIVDSGMDIGQMSDLELENLKNTHRLQQIGATQNAIAERQVGPIFQVGDRLFQIDPRTNQPIEIRLPAEGTPYRPGTARGTNEEQIAKGRFNRAQEYAMRNPDVAQWLEIDPNSRSWRLKEGTPTDIANRITNFIFSSEYHPGTAPTLDRETGKPWNPAEGLKEYTDVPIGPNVTSGQPGFIQRPDGSYMVSRPPTSQERAEGDKVRVRLPDGRTGLYPRRLIGGLPPGSQVLR